MKKEYDFCESFDRTPQPFSDEVVNLN